MIQKVINKIRSEGFYTTAGSAYDFLRYKYRRQVESRIHSKYIDLQNQKSYPINPPTSRDIIYVDPNNIKYRIFPRLEDQFSLKPSGSYVLDGDWDLCEVYDKEWYSIDSIKPTSGKLPIEKYALFKSMKNHFLKDVPWDETEWYMLVNENNTIGDLGRQYEDSQSMENQLKLLDKLFEDIRTEGYKTQREIGNHSPYPEYDEIKAIIGRDGEIYKSTSGRHRLILCKLLELDEIPVRVFVRHKKWQTKREIITKSCHDRENRSDSEHPDLPHT